MSEYWLLSFFFIIMEEGRGCSACTKAYKASRSVGAAPKAWVIKKSQPRSCRQRAMWQFKTPHFLWDCWKKHARAASPLLGGGRSRLRQHARTYPKKGLRENLGVPRATGRPRVTRPGSFQDLKEAYETYGSPRVTRRPRRPKRPRVTRPRVTRRPRRPKRPKLMRPTGGARVRDLGLSEDLGFTSLQRAQWGRWRRRR